MHSHQCQGPNTVTNTSVITASMVSEVPLVVSQCHSMTSADSTSKQPTVAASTALGSDWSCRRQSNRFQEGGFGAHRPAICKRCQHAVPCTVPGLAAGRKQRSGLSSKARQSNMDDSSAGSSTCC